MYLMVDGEMRIAYLRKFNFYSLLTSFQSTFIKLLYDVPSYRIKLVSPSIWLSYKNVFKSVE